MTFEVVSATETARGTEAKLLVRSGDAVANPMTWLVNDKGIFQLSATVGDTKGGKLEYKFQPERPEIAFPLKEGRTFSYSGTGPVITGGTAPMKVDGKILGFQTVDTEIGSMQAIAVETTTTWSATTNGKSVPFTERATSWYAPDKGLVRLHQEVTFPTGQMTVTIRLKTKPN